jgi:hypothetical protein
MMTSRSVPLRLLFAALSAGCGDGEVATHPTPIRINEVCPNNVLYQDMTGDTDNWIELYNMSDTAVDPGGYFISDVFDEPPTAWVHLGFKLSSESEGVWLSNPDGYLIDSVELARIPPIGAGTVRSSLARFPDGTGAFRWCSEASPDGVNGSRCQGEIL